MSRFFLILAAIAIALSASANQKADRPDVIRVNKVGYRTADIKAAVYLGNTDPKKCLFSISDGSRVYTPDSVVVTSPWAPMQHSARIYFSSLQTPGNYTVSVTPTDGTKPVSESIYIGNDAYSRRNLNELPLNYLRQQRCGYNPVYNTHCHPNDGILVLAGDADGMHFDVTGGWHDASDYLQYLTTSANTVYQLLFAYKSTPHIWADNHNAAGQLGANGIPDILDEARWGLEWMLRMNPNDTLFLNQIADDRDHRFVGLPHDDNSDYGWGEGGARPVYPCSAKPYGLYNHKNDSKGLASSVAKFASSFALGAEIFADIDPIFASEMAAKSANAYNVAFDNPGACQTAPCVSPYYYEEDNYVDDMELAAMELYHATGDIKYLRHATDFGRMEPVTPWMGADSAHHYQWYPFINLGHYHLAKADNNRLGREFVRNMRSGIERVAQKGADNAFLSGIPYIWCSNNLAVAFVTQAMLYRELSGDNSFLEAETATRDWLFGANPWGQTMIIMPDRSVNGIEPIPSPVDPHSAAPDLVGRDVVIGGLVDGPVYANIFNSLWGVHLRRGEDIFAPYQNSVVVYHDDFSDYSTNEPTMDGTASLTFMLGRLCTE